MPTTKTTTQPKMVEPVETDRDPNETGVIGAGFGRTGTNSLMFALDEIGVGATMHMLRLLGGSEPLFPTRLRRILAFSSAGAEKDKQKRQELLRVAMKGYRSEVDFPASIFYKDFMEMYPNKKVVLTVRGNASEWLKSCQATICKMIFPDFAVDPFLWLFVKITPPGMFVDYFFTNTIKQVLPSSDPQLMLAVYDKWVEDVKRSVPKERLLVFDVKEGWEPLAKSLDLPTPSTPFPRLNDADQINAEFNGMRAVGALALVFYLIMAFLLGRKALRMVGIGGQRRIVKSSKAE